MSLNYQIIGKRLRRYRKKQHLSQLTIAERIGKSPSYLSYLESGSKHPSLETLVNIINVLGVSADMVLAENVRANRMVASSEFQQILSDCSEKEVRILLAVVRDLKRILRENKE